MCGSLVLNFRLDYALRNFWLLYTASNSKSGGTWLLRIRSIFLPSGNKFIALESMPCVRIRDLRYCLVASEVAR
jgi:hypothetical protein